MKLREAKLISTVSSTAEDIKWSQNRNQLLNTTASTIHNNCYTNTNNDGNSLVLNNKENDGAPSKLVLLLTRRLFRQFFNDSGSSSRMIINQEEQYLYNIASYLIERLYKNIFIKTNVTLSTTAAAASSNQEEKEEENNNNKEEGEGLTTWIELVQKYSNTIKLLKLKLKERLSQVDHYGALFRSIQQSVTNVALKWQKPTVKVYFTQWVQQTNSNKQVIKIAMLQSANLKLMRLAMNIRFGNDGSETRIKLNSNTKPLIKSWIKLILKMWKDVAVKNQKINEYKKSSTLEAHQKMSNIKMLESKEKLYNLKRSQVRLISTYLDVSNRLNKVKKIYYLCKDKIDHRQEEKSGKICDCLSKMSIELISATTHTMMSLSKTNHVLQFHMNKWNAMKACSIQQNGTLLNEKIKKKFQLYEDALSLSFVRSTLPSNKMLEETTQLLDLSNFIFRVQEEQPEEESKHVEQYVALVIKKGKRKKKKMKNNCLKLLSMILSKSMKHLIGMSGGSSSTTSATNKRGKRERINMPPSLLCEDLNRLFHYPHSSPPRRPRAAKNMINILNNKKNEIYIRLLFIRYEMIGNYLNQIQNLKIKNKKEDAVSLYKENEKKWKATSSDPMIMINGWKSISKLEFHVCNVFLILLLLYIIINFASFFFLLQG
jgi:hypothetical protein